MVVLLPVCLLATSRKNFQTDLHKFSGKAGNGPMKKNSAVAEMDDRLATIDMGQKVGADVPLSMG